MAIYRGIVNVQNGKCTLNLDGLTVGLEGDIAQFVPFNGTLISVEGEPQGNIVIQNASPVAVAESAIAGAVVHSDELAGVVAAIRSQLENILPVAGVVGVRPGYSVEPADENRLVIIVVTDPAKEPGSLPTQINGIKVELRKATALEMVEGIAPLSAWEDGVEAEAAPNINYVPPPANRVSLKEMEVSDITCHIGPDSGWTTLQPYLEATTKSLTVAMYEFYAEHILDTMTTLGEDTDINLNMILQVDKNDKDCENTLRKSWGNRLEFVPASVHGPNRIFNNSYHTKVAVRDSKDVWVSSGNWSPNSQPLIKPGTENTLYKNGNREWHVIIKDKEIAEMYEKFILYDMEMAANVGEMEAAPIMPDLLVPESFFVTAEAAVLQDHPFIAKSFALNGEKVKIKPLMSPDNYAQGILDLINSATKSLYLQFAYINQPSTGIFDKIIDAISQKMKEGLDVKVIAGSNEKPESIDLLFGKRKWKRSMFRIQKTKLHNKGVIVDGKAAVVGSNNWSNDGTQFNRDTSIIFYSKPIARYFTEVFEFDWLNLTKPAGSVPEMVPELAPETGPTPPGMVRIPWAAYYNE